VSLTDPAFFKQLDRLRIRVRAARGHRPGETPIPRTSQAWGVEFESYKDYTPGDDFRYLDWNAASRLDKLMVRTFTAEREIPFHLILDTSASMGAPSRDKKFGVATDLTAALSYIVLSSNNTLRIAALSSTEKGQRPFWATPFLRHRNRFLRVPPFLESLSPAGKTYLRESIQAYVSQTKEPGVVILVSDFLTPPRQYEAALLFLIARGYEVKAIHVMGDSELHPERLFRRGKLYDVEAQTERSVTLSSANLVQYQDALSTHCEAVQQFCHQHQILYVCVSTVQPIMQTVTDTLARSGLLTLH